jgi:RimJ/RimL family protein N-acetyltransferase
MTLVNISARPDAARVLYDLLAEREAHQSISHKGLPTWEQHIAFLKSKPYAAHYLIEENCGIVGATYLTRQDEIGIFIFKKYQRKGFAREAVLDLMRRHPRKRYLWNANPNNAASIALSESLGFTHLQSTYSRSSAFAQVAAE